MDWNCTLTEEALSDFLDGALAAEERAALASHAAQCEKCAQMVEQVGAMVRGLQSLAPVEEPPHLTANILRATLGAPYGQSVFQRWLGWLGEIGQTRFAMGVATVAASLAIVLHVAGPNLRHVKAADLAPANVVRRADRGVHLSYARAARFVSDLRVVYEIQSRFASQPQPQRSPAPQQPSTPATGEPPGKSSTEPDSGGGGTRGGELAAQVIGW